MMIVCYRVNDEGLIERFVRKDQQEWCDANPGKYADNFADGLQILFYNQALGHLMKLNDKSDSMIELLGQIASRE